MKFKITYSILFFFCIFSVFAQRTLTGRVLDEHMEIAMEIKVFDKDTTQLGKSDFNGYFQIELPKNSEKLIFAGLGYEWATITIPKECKTLEIVLLLSGTYDFMSSNKIDRLRKKKFDNLSELHSAAFQKGLFKTEKPCFNQQFEPIKVQLDKITQRSKELMKENKNNFELLKVGDTIRIPFSGEFKYDGTERTKLIVYSYLAEGKAFDCEIQGVVTEKRKNRKGYFLTYKVTDTSNCEYKSIVYNDKPVQVAQILEHNMKYFKVITK